MAEKKKSGIEELTVGMQVEVTNKNTSNKQTGMVTHIEETKKGKFIDGKPVINRKIVSMTISLDQGHDLVLNGSNYREYQICTIK